ncbi:hypothetical protein BR141012304_20197 [Brucella inopinata]|nr:hypothetical protein BR141012304_20197 [Brucella inopinata]
MNGRRWACDGLRALAFNFGVQKGHSFGCMQGVENASGLSLVIRYIYYGLRCDKLFILKKS